MSCNIPPPHPAEQGRSRSKTDPGFSAGLGAPPVQVEQSMLGTEGAPAKPCGAGMWAARSAKICSTYTC